MSPPVRKAIRPSTSSPSRNKRRKPRKKGPGNRAFFMGAPKEGAGRRCVPRTPIPRQNGGASISCGSMDKRKAWREQEQQLVERWNAAASRFRDAQAALSSQSTESGDAAPHEEKVLKAKAARAELEAVRKQVARLKVEFSAGKRY